MKKLTDKFVLFIPVFFIVLASCSSTGSSSSNVASGMREETKQFCDNNSKVKAFITLNNSVKDDKVLTLLADMDEWSGTASPSDELESKLAENHLLLTEQILKLYADNTDQLARDEFIMISGIINAFCISAKNGNL
jgi:acyl-coenzyme A synthetase/AMP-(fatty) acid ligase